MGTTQPLDSPPDAQPPPGVYVGGRSEKRAWDTQEQDTPPGEDETTPLRCHSCRRPTPRLIEAYWGQSLCPECAADAGRERDAGESWPTPWWEVATPPHIAVLGSDGLWRCNLPLHEFPASLAELGALVELLGVRQVWVHRSAFDRLGLPEQIYPPRGGGHIHPFTQERGAWRSGRQPGLKHWAYWYTPGGHGFDLHIPAYGRSAWQACDSAPELLARVAQFDRATRGVEWKGEGTITSDVFLKKRLRKVLRPTEIPPPVESGAAHEVAATWHRAPREDEAGHWYVHALDLNLAYASGASSIALPLGPCEYVDWPSFDSNTAGVYLVEGPFPVYHPGIVPDTPYRDGTEGPHWVTAPTLQRLEGRGVHALEGYVWPGSKRHLRPWYEMVRDARAELLDGGSAGLDAVKAMCREGLGRMASKLRTLPEGKTLADDPTYQPVWSWSVIAEVRERLLARVADISDPRGVHVEPVAIDTDCLYFLSRRSSPAALAVALGLPLGDGLGQFKPAGTCRAKDAREALEMPRTPDALRALGELVK